MGRKRACRDDGRSNFTHENVFQASSRRHPYQHERSRGVRKRKIKNHHDDRRREAGYEGDACLSEAENSEHKYLTYPARTRRRQQPNRLPSYRHGSHLGGQDMEGGIPTHPGPWKRAHAIPPTHQPPPLPQTQAVGFCLPDPAAYSSFTPFLLAARSVAPSFDAAFGISDMETLLAGTFDHAGADDSQVLACRDAENDVLMHGYACGCCTDDAPLFPGVRGHALACGHARRVLGALAFKSYVWSRLWSDPASRALLGKAVNRVLAARLRRAAAGPQPAWNGAQGTRRVKGDGLWGRINVDAALDALVGS